MGPLRILLAEDDAVLGELLGEVLRGLGHEVCATEVTQAATIAAAERERPDLMILDRRLATGTGEAAAAAILQVRAIPHVFMSGDGGDAASGIVLRKPFREADLVRAIDRAVAVQPAARPGP